MKTYTVRFNKDDVFSMIEFSQVFGLKLNDYLMLLFNCILHWDKQDPITCVDRHLLCLSQPDDLFSERFWNNKICPDFIYTYADYIDWVICFIDSYPLFSKRIGNSIFSAYMLSDGIAHISVETPISNSQATFETRYFI